MGIFRKTADKNDIELKIDSADKPHRPVFEGELLAVISAAIAAMEKRPGFRLEVNNIRHIPGASPVWNTAGRAERMLRNLNA